MADNVQIHNVLTNSTSSETSSEFILSGEHQINIFGTIDAGDSVVLKVDGQPITESDGTDISSITTPINSLITFAGAFTAETVIAGTSDISVTLRRVVSNTRY